MEERMIRRTALVVVVTFVAALTMTAQDLDPEYRATFSIIARDPATAELGHAETSKALAGGTNFGAAKGGVGVITNQAATFMMYGKVGIQMLEMGFTPEQALQYMLKTDEQRENRQVAIIDAQGRTAAFTGANTSDWHGHKCGVNYCVQANTMTGPEVVAAVSRSFEGSSGPLAERLLDALDAGQAQGGDKRGKQEAYLIVVRQGASSGGWSDKVVEIRVDDNPVPLVEARRILNKVRSGRILTEGNQKLNSQDASGALQLFIAARDKSPDNDNAWIALANGYLRNNRKTEALEALRKAAELNPNNRTRLPTNANFQSLLKDPEFLKIVGQQ
jgi:uncharacterized Ntn-hydrolase superfamily protein